MYEGFTGYVIKEDYDLNNLKKDYGFREPPKYNLWWQRPFNIKWRRFYGIIDCQLMVNKENRKLYRLCDDGCNTDELDSTFEKMKQDGILVLTESEGEG